MLAEDVVWEKMLGTSSRTVQHIGEYFPIIPIPVFPFIFKVCDLI